VTVLSRRRRSSATRDGLPLRPAAVLFDRDGTLIRDVPYNGDPDRVTVMPGAAEALEYLRSRDIPLGVVTNQSGVDHGWVTMAEVRAVNARIEQLLGPFATWQVCPHLPDARCGCRKPRPGLLLAAARALAVDVAQVVMIGDIESDLAAAAAAGSYGILVPTDRTRTSEVRRASRVALNLGQAVTMAAVPT
jgi:D-glycero-D-manno-heptose 1,7-bisphosphate phosphatase